MESGRPSEALNLCAGDDGLCPVALDRRVLIVAMVSQFCGSMIGMSQAKLTALLISIGAWAALAGCCGGGPSHKCDFTPPTVQMDAGGSDAAMPCGTEVCQAPQVCCLKKIAPFASCIDPADYVADACEMIQMNPPPCTRPTDCDGGTVCCLENATETISCQPPPLCPGDATHSFLICASDMDCPNQQAGSCRNVDTGTTGVSLNVCAP
jgi:hypothetical protein